MSPFAAVVRMDAVREASDEDDASDDGRALRRNISIPVTAEVPPRTGTPSLAASYEPAPFLWDALSKPDTELHSQQLPFDCCDRSVNLVQVSRQNPEVQFLVCPSPAAMVWGIARSCSSALGICFSSH